MTKLMAIIAGLTLIALVTAACGDDERYVARHDPSFAKAKNKAIALAGDSPLSTAAKMIVLLD